MNQKILFLLLALVFSFVVRGQDIIYKTDGTEIKAKVIEIDENVVKYKNFDQLDGPLRSIGKIQVFLIIYANGQREKFETPKKEEMQPEPKEYQTAEIIKQPFEKPKQDNTLTKNYLDMKVEQAKTMENVGKGMFYGGFIGVGVGFLTAISSSDGIAGDIVMLVSGVVMNIGWPLWIAGSITRKGFEKRRYEISLFLVPPMKANTFSSITNLPQIGMKIRF